MMWRNKTWSVPYCSYCSLERDTPKLITLRDVVLHRKPCLKLRAGLMKGECSEPNGELGIRNFAVSLAARAAAYLARIAGKRPRG